MDSLISGLACILVMLVGVVPFALVVGIVGQAGKLRRLTSRVDQLEAELVALRRQVVAGGQRSPSTADVAIAPSSVPAKVVQPKPTTEVAPAPKVDTSTSPVPAAEPASTGTPAPVESPLAAAPEVVVPPPVGETLAAPAPEPAADSPAPSPSAPSAPVPPRPAPENTRPAAPEFNPERIALWVLAAAGGGLLLLAALFGFREVIKAGLVGPGMRFASGLSVGLVAWAIGEFLRSRRYTVPAEALVGAGAAILYGALYAGVSLYGVLPQPVAFGAMVLVTIVTMLAAVGHRSRFQAALGAIGGYLTPILLSTGENKALAFMAYLVLLTAGLLVAARRRSWPELVGLAALFCSVLLAGWIQKFYAPDQVAIGLGGAAALAGIFLLAARLRNPKLDSVTTMTAWVGAVMVGMVGSVYIVPVDPGNLDPISSLPLSWSQGQNVYLAGAYVLYVSLGTLLCWRPGGGDALRQPLMALAGGVPALLLWLYAGGWLGAAQPHWAPVLGLLALLPVAVTILGSGWAGPVVLGAAAVAGAVGVGVAEPDPELVPLLALLLGLPPVVLFRWKGPREGLLLGAAAGALILLAGREHLPDAVSYSLLATTILYICWFFPPFWKPRKDDTWAVAAATLIGVFLFEPFRQLWSLSVGTGLMGGLPLLLGASLLGGGASLLRNRTLRLDDRMAGVIVGLVLLAAAVAVPLQLERAWLTVGWAAEVALLALCWRRLRMPMFPAFAAVLGAAVVVRLVLNREAWAGGAEGAILFNWILYTWGIPATLLLVAGVSFTVEEKAPPLLPVMLKLASILLFFITLNLEISHAFAVDNSLSFVGEGLAQEMTRSISWAAFGLLLIVVGSIWESRWGRFLGLMFALLGVAKACLWDLWQLSGFYRVGSFAGMAIALMLAAIAFQRLVLRDRSAK